MILGYTTAQVWLIIALMGIGTYLIRLSFIGLFGNRHWPDWVLAHLRYTAVAVIPGMVAPMVLFPAATGGQPDAARLIAAAVTLAVGYRTKNVIIAIFSGAATLGLCLLLLGQAGT